MATRADIPATSNNGVNVAEGTVLSVLASSGLSPFIRKLTWPVGNWFSHGDIFTSYVTSSAHSSWAPGRIPTIDSPLTLRLERGAGGGLLVRVLGGRPGDMLRLESSGDLANWDQVSDFQQTIAGAEAVLAPEPAVRARFYRIVRMAQ